MNCGNCGKEFIKNTGTNGGMRKRFCSNKCSTAYYVKSRKRIVYQNISTGTIGAIHELVVCTDLMTKGFDVFRAVSQSCFIDLVAIKNGNILKIEVTTGTFTHAGALSYPKKNFDLFDHLAVVSPSGILYIPEINVKP
jgi:hypothetical protein